jgi:cystathionine beta-lyase/cystathionine gamma-synthase
VDQSVIYSRDDATATWEALQELVGGLEGGVAGQFMTDFGAVLSFDVHGGAARADALCRAPQIIRHPISLGGVESTVERRAAIPGQTHLPRALLRLSVGCEHVKDLIADLDQALHQTAGLGSSR